MTTLHLKAIDEASLYAALEAAELVTPAAFAVVEGRAGYSHNVFLTVIGLISKPNGDVDCDGNPIYAPIPGFHANVYDPITDAQKALLPWIDPPAVPVRVKAGG